MIGSEEIRREKGRRIKKLLELNKLPVNQVAKEYLEKAGQDPAPDMALHVYHLIEWALKETDLEAFSPTTHPEQATLEMIAYVEYVMRDGHPQAYMDLLAKKLPGLDDPLIDPQGMKLQQTPKKAAAYLLDALLSAMTEISEPERPE